MRIVTMMLLTALVATSADAQISTRLRPDARPSAGGAAIRMAPLSPFDQRYIVKLVIRQNGQILGSPSFFAEVGHTNWAIVDGKYRWSVSQSLDNNANPAQLALKIEIATWTAGKWQPGFSGTLFVGSDGSTTSATMDRIAIDAKLIPKPAT